MPIKYPPPARTILICDYSKGGFKAPEMVKRRPAIVLHSRLPRRNNLATVVPLSGTESGESYHLRLELPEPLPEPFPETVWWAKADMVASVAYDRLDFFRTDRDLDGKRQYLNNIKISDIQLEDLKAIVRRALGL